MKTLLVLIVLLALPVLAVDIQRIEPYSSFAPNWDLNITRELEWAATAEALAIGGGIPVNHTGAAYWDSISGNLGVRFGVEVEGSDPTVRRTSVQRAQGDPAFLCDPTDNTGRRPWGCPWNDGEVWITDKGLPTVPLTFVGAVDDPATPRTENRLWALYPTGCAQEHEDQDICDASAAGDMKEFRPEQIGGNVLEGGGRWNGTAWFELSNPQNTIGIDLFMRIHSPGFLSPGGQRNLRVRFFDSNVNLVGVSVVDALDLLPIYGHTQTHIRLAFSDFDEDVAIKTVAVDSVDGQIFAVLRIFSSPSYVPDTLDIIAPPVCAPPQQGVHVDFDPDTQITIDPTLHYRSGAFSHPLLAFTHWGDESGPHPSFPAETMNQKWCFCSTSNGCTLDADSDTLPNQCDGDFNNDGTVNSTDGSLFLADLGGQDSGIGTDMNGDGTVNSTDGGLFLTQLGGAPCD